MKQQYTPGPWRWEFSRRSKRVELCGGNPHYDQTVMDFARFGMADAAPRFREDEEERRIQTMHRCEKYAVEVPGREHHAHWFMGLNHPDARLIAAAPDLLEALKKAESVMQILLREYQEEWESDAPAPECVNATFVNMGCIQSAIDSAERRLKP